tara:strand:+ start:978 stop:1889 length:912 start_codon:yes stop_codon:yes gene_type:complete
MGKLDETNPNFSQSDSVQIGDNAIGPSTGDIIINSGTNEERCSMCKTPIDAQNNPGLYCFKEGCNTLFCANCESFFRAKREPGEKPYCADHISEFVGPMIPSTPPGLISESEPTSPQQVAVQPTPVMITPSVQQVHPVQVFQQSQPVRVHQYIPGGMQGATQGMYQVQHNPYVNQLMIDPVTAFLRTIKSWNGEGRAQRSEYWWGSFAYAFCIGFVLTFIMIPSSFMLVDSSSNRADFTMIMLLFTLVLFISYIPLFSQTIRRLHDAGYSGWFIALFLIPYVGGFILLIMCVLPSQPHPNKYG